MSLVLPFASPIVVRDTKQNKTWTFAAAGAKRRQRLVERGRRQLGKGERPPTGALSHRTHTHDARQEREGERVSRRRQADHKANTNKTCSQHRQAAWFVECELSHPQPRFKTKTFAFKCKANPKFVNSPISFPLSPKFRIKFCSRQRSPQPDQIEQQ